jgi:hypothetical protein
MTHPEPSEPTRFKFVIEGVGPLTRATVGSDPVSPREQALSDALHWIWSWGVQFQRLVQSQQDEWSGKTGPEFRRAASRFSFDEHILCVTGWNLARAIERLEAFLPSASIPSDNSEALKLLRNLYEHWDEQREAFQSPSALKVRSAADFIAQFPEGKPWSIIFGEHDWFHGGVVPINGVSQALAPIERAVLKAEGTSKDTTVPGD